MARKKKAKKNIGRSLYNMPIPTHGEEIVEFFMRPQDLLYGMDGKAWIWHEARTWRSGKQPKSAVIKIKRKAKPFWAVTIPDDVTINAGDPEVETWVEIEVEEPRTPLNQNPFVAIVEGMEGMGAVMQDLNTAFEGATRAIASGSRALMGSGKRPQSKKKMVMMPVVDRSDGKVKIMSMPEAKAKKLKKLAGHDIAEVVMDERNGTISFDEDGNQTFTSMADEIAEIVEDAEGTETLNITDMLANKFEPKEA